MRSSRNRIRARVKADLPITFSEERMSARASLGTCSACWLPAIRSTTASAKIRGSNASLSVRPTAGVGSGRCLCRHVGGRHAQECGARC